VTGKNLDRLKDSLFYYEQKLETLKSQISKLDPLYDELKTHQKLLSFEEFQASLKPSEVFLEYFYHDSDLFAFIIGKDAHSFQKIALSENYEALLADFLSGFTYKKDGPQFPDEKYIEQASQLYKILLQPLWKSLENELSVAPEKLIIVADGELNYLPWGALLTGKPDDIKNYRSYPFLEKELKIRLAFSASLMKFLESKPSQKKEMMLAFAPGYLTKGEIFAGKKGSESRSCEDIFDPNFTELTQSKLELDKILSHIGGERFDSLEARENKFKELAKDHRLIHLSMHGFIDNCDPMYSGLAFTPKSMLEKSGEKISKDPTNDGILHAYEIYNMQLNAELLVMSACETGLGEIQKGEGVMSIARAFAYAGSKNTIMSLWQVEESATRRLMDVLYKHIAAGKGKDDALQLAKKEYIHRYQNAHPYYWAGFTLIGDDKAIEFDPWWQRNIWIVVLAFLLLLLALFLRKRRG
ncbi:MAG: CHAT domain-containing protein, partial [Bacteroidota bacterium]